MTYAFTSLKQMTDAVVWFSKLLYIIGFLWNVGRITLFLRTTPKIFSDLSLKFYIDTDNFRFLGHVVLSVCLFPHDDAD